MPDDTPSRSGPLQGGITEEGVLGAAAALVAAFRATDTDAYFAAFATDATFVFHTEERRIETRAEYEDLWRGWLAEGWHVTECVSSNPRVQLLGTAAVFTHDVLTTTSVGGTARTTHERETIVFEQTEGAGMKAVHEHLSPLPSNTPETSAS